MRWSCVIGAVGCGLVAPAGALGAGGPVPPLQGGRGVAVAGSPFRYVARGTGRDTVVVRLTPGGAREQASIRVSGRYGIPGADFNGSTTGLSADGRTLILEQLPGSRPLRTTRLVVLRTPGLAVLARLTLPGFSTVDAISPDGRWLYLIHYRASDVSKYEVRAYDLPVRRLIPTPVVDPHDRGEAMTGFPVARESSADGRWAYTLYGRPAGVPFVHALDTVARRAVCIDLPSVSDADIGSARLVLASGGATLRVEVGGASRATIDTRTFAIDARHHPGGSTAPRPDPPATASTGEDGGIPWEYVLIPIAVLATLGVALKTRLT